MNAEVYRAIKSRLDVRCIEWAYLINGYRLPARCGTCDGCTAATWLSEQKVDA